MKPIQLGYNSLYVVEDQGRRILVDAGPDYLNAWQALTSALGSAGPDMVAITHGHLDHAGLASRWIEHGVEVGLGGADRHLAAGPALAGHGEWAMLRGFIDASGAPADVAAGAHEALRQRREWSLRAANDSSYHPASARDGRWPTALRYPPFTASRTLDDGDLIGAGLEVVSCPGHTPGNLVLVHRGEGWLFSGDQLLPSITPTPAIQTGFAGEGIHRFRSLPRFVESLRHLRGMAFSRCYPGHGTPFDNVAEVIDANLAQVTQRAERVVSLLGQHGALSTYAVADALYPRALTRRFWQIIATVQGQLDLLEEERRVACHEGRWSNVP